jgi:hypothetical protein
LGVAGFEPQRFLIAPHGFGRLPLFHQGIAQVAVNLRVAGCDAEGFAEMPDGLIESFLDEQNRGKIVVRAGGIGIIFQRRFEIHNGLGILLFRRLGKPQVAQNISLGRCDFQGFAVIGEVRTSRPVPKSSASSINDNHVNGCQLAKNPVVKAQTRFDHDRPAST